MEYVLLVVVLLQGLAITYLMVNKKPKPLTLDEQAQMKLENENKQWQKLFSYNEGVANRGYRE